VNPTPPRAQSPLVKASSASSPPRLASPVESSKQQRSNRLSLLSFRRGGSTHHTRTPSTKLRPLEPTVEELLQGKGVRARAASAAATAGTATIAGASLDNAADKKKVNGTFVTETSTDMAIDRPTTRQSDYSQSHGDDSIAKGGSGGVKKRFSFIGITGQVGSKLGKKPSVE